MRRSIVFAAFISCGWVTACSAPSGVLTNAQAGRVVNDAKAGFKIVLPKGWSTKLEGNHFRVRTADPSAYALAIPIWLNKPLTSREIIESVPKALPEEFPGATLDEVREVGPSGRQAIGDVRLAQGARGQILCALSGNSGMVYVLVAPETRFQNQRTALLRALSTLRFRPVAPPAGASGSVEYVRWTDPKEHAFSIDVPKGWSVEGGLFRYSSTDVRPEAVLASKDRTIGIRVGSSDVPKFAIPNAYLSAAGLREGATYDLGTAKLEVMHYMTGGEFAKSFAEEVADSFTDVQSSAKEIPEASSKANQAYAVFQRYGISVSASVGLAKVTGSRDGKPMMGEYMATTCKTTNGQIGMWNVEPLVGYMAERDSAPAAAAILKHVAQSFRYEPEWLARQQQLTRDTSAIVTKANKDIMEIVHGAMQYRNATLEKSNRDWDDYIRGVYTKRDPDTGDLTQVPNDAMYYKGPQGQRVGTTGNSPGVDWKAFLDPK